MPIESVLMDRGRILRQAAQPLKVEGRTQFVEVEHGAWFDCRLFLGGSPESPEPGGVRRKVTAAPTLMYGVEDDAGNPLQLVATDRVEVESEDLGSAVWRLTGDPDAFRRKEGVIGFQVTVSRVFKQFDPKS